MIQNSVSDIEVVANGNVRPPTIGNRSTPTTAHRQHRYMADIARPAEFHFLAETG
jgi:hypothetical protein